MSDDSAQGDNQALLCSLFLEALLHKVSYGIGGGQDNVNLTLNLSTLGVLLDFYHEVFATLVDLPEARKPQSASALKTRAGLADVRTAPGLAEALAPLKAQEGRIVVAGSLYLYQRL